MATSRTGTTTYLRNRAKLIATAQADGLTHCPGFEHHPCGQELDYDTPLQPNSVEADHIVTAAQTGDPDDAVTNLRILCRACNNARNRNQPSQYGPDGATLLTW